MFIITNTTPDGEYTPSKAETFEEAQDFMLETTIENYTAGNADFSDFADETETEECSTYAELKEKGLVKRFLDWMVENNDGEYTETSTAVYYGDDSFNKMNIYNLDEI